MFDKRLRPQLLETLNTDLAIHGFRLQKRQDRFIRAFKNAGISHFFILLFLSSEHGYRIFPQVAIRLDAVETIFHFTSGFEKKYQPHTPTIGSNIWRILGTESYVRLSSWDDLEASAHTLSHLFTTFALPYFDRCSEIGTIDQTLNDRPNDYSPHRIMDYLRASTGIIAAKLNNRSNYNELVEIYRQQMGRFANGFYLPRYEALVGHLEASDPTKREN